MMRRLYDRRSILDGRIQLLGVALGGWARHTMRGVSGTLYRMGGLYWPLTQEDTVLSKRNEAATTSSTIGQVDRRVHV